MDEKLLKKLLRKSCAIEYTWPNISLNLRNLVFMNDQDDRDVEFKYITGSCDVHKQYDLSRNVYLYRRSGRNLVCIAIISDKGIKVL